jgi:hypothetical protein
LSQHGPTRVGTSAAVAKVEPWPASQEIVAAVPFELVGAALTEEPVVTIAARELVGSSSTLNAIAVQPALHLVVSTPGTDEVVTAATANLIVSAARHNHVASGGSDDLIGPGGPRNRRSDTAALRNARCGRICADRIEERGQCKSASGREDADAKVHLRIRSHSKPPSSLGERA